MELITSILTLLPLLKTSDEGQKRKNLRLIKKTRKKLYKEYKKDGFTEDEKTKLTEIDNAIVEALIELGKF